MNSIPSVENDYGAVEILQDTGFSSIPSLITQNVTEHGFVLNIMVVSRRGLGATTLINSLFASPLLDRNRGDSLTTTVNEIVENEVRLKVSVTSFHGEGFKDPLAYIEEKNREYFEKEQGLAHKIEDKRVHVCIYLVPADKMHKREIDGVKELSAVCNVISVVPKADMYTVDEIKNYKSKINGIFETNAIATFEYFEGSGCSDVNELMSRLQTTDNEKGSESVWYPLSTIASEKTYDFQGRIIRGRRYPWGFIDIANEQYSDFKKLQRVLLSSNYVDLINKTETKYYSEFRSVAIKNETEDKRKERNERLYSEMERILEEKHKKALEELERDGANSNDTVSAADEPFRAASSVNSSTTSFVSANVSANRSNASTNSKEESNVHLRSKAEDAIYGKGAADNKETANKATANNSTANKSAEPSRDMKVEQPHAFLHKTNADGSETRNHHAAAPVNNKENPHKNDKEESKKESTAESDPEEKVHKMKISELINKQKGNK
ncbi:septin 4 [Enteropsectra breve]|nr:septin 4 [Enteropsectra breve]